MSAYSSDENPFSDPSVQNAVQVDEYNPFDGSKAPAAAYNISENAYSNKSPPKQQKGNNSEPAAYKPPVMKGESAYNQNNAFSGNAVNSEAANLREQNLRRREEYIAAKEKQIEDREKKLTGFSVMRPHNYPWCYPVIFHDIDIDIPARFRPQMKYLHAMLYCTWTVLFWNWICVWGMIYGASIGLSSTEILWASIYLVMGTVGAWYGWYMKIYEVLRDQGSLGWFSFFFWFFLHGCFAIIMCIGVPETAAAGTINFFTLLAKGYNSIAILVLPAMLLWGLIALASFYLARSFYYVWIEEGGDAKAKQDLTNIAVEGVVNAQMNQNSLKAPLQNPN